MLPAPTVTVTLPDGRTLACDDVGDRRGTPVVHLHGSPDSRFARHPDDGVAERSGVRLLAVDRPGYGDTDPVPGDAGDDRCGAVRRWADDVAVLLDELGVERCRVAAWSAGSNWAWGLAAGLGRRVERVITFGALCTFEDLVDPEVREASASRLYAVDEVAGGRSVDDVLAEIDALSYPPRPVDLHVARELLLDQYTRRTREAVGSVPGLLDQLTLSFAGAVHRHGLAGLREDLALQSSTGIAAMLEDVHQRVVLVAGTRDRLSGVAASRSLAARLRDAEVVEWPVGHQGLLTDWPRWLELLAAS